MTVSEEQVSEKRATLVYECPHCGAGNHVDPASVGDPVRCLNDDCGRQFRPEIPTGHLVADGGATALPSVTHDGDSQVASNETELLTAHPAMFGNAPMYFLGCLILITGGFVGAAVAGQQGETTLTAIAAAAAAIGLVWLGSWWVKTRFQTVLVTSKRTIYRQGIFAKQTSEVQHDDVRNMQVHQGFVDRLLGVGHIAISSSGQDDMEIDVRGLKSPERVIEIIRRYQ